MRIRLAWLSATAQQLAPYLGLLIVIIFLTDWLTAWNGSIAWSLGALAGFVLALGTRAATFRITDWEVSRAAERGLGARDAFTTALEFSDPGNDVHRAIQAEADEIAFTASPKQAIPVRPQADRLRQVGLAAALALALAFLPPLSDTPALSTDIQTALEAEAQEVERIADAIAAEEVENSEELLEELRRLAEELRTAQSLEEALESLADADTRLDAKLDPNQLAQKAAVQGLANDLALRPLVDGSTLDAASQFEELAEILDQLSEPELRALQDRLSQLATSQAAGNPDLANQLSDAASSLAAGDLASAQQALTQAASEQREGVSQARGQQAISEVQSALGSISSRLSGEGAEGEGEGSAGDGGQGGEGQPGTEGGPGQGEGGQSGSAAPGGEISDVAPGSGDAEGQGGEGTVGTGSDDEHGTSVETASVYDPAYSGPASDLLQVHISGSDGQGDITGLKDAPTQQGESVVPYATVLPQYLNEAADALGALRLPPAMRSIVQSYFARLAAAAQ